MRRGEAEVGLPAKGGWGRTLRTVALWLPALAWMGVIFWVSSIPGSKIPGGYSTLGHFTEYFVLGALLTLPLRLRLSRGEAIAVAVLLASLFAVTDEFHQAFVPLRTPDVADWGMDTIGAFVGAFVGTWIAAAAARASAARARTSDSRSRAQ